MTEPSPPGPSRAVTFAMGTNGDDDDGQRTKKQSTDIPSIEAALNVGKPWRCLRCGQDSGVIQVTDTTANEPRLPRILPCGHDMCGECIKKSGKSK